MPPPFGVSPQSSGNAELIAYAAKSVNEPVERLNQLMRQSLSIEALLQLHSLPDLRKDKEEAIDRQDFDAAVTHRGHEIQTLKLAGQASGIDVAAIESLCDTIIVEARKDL